MRLASVSMLYHTLYQSILLQCAFDQAVFRRGAGTSRDSRHSTGRATNQLSWPVERECQQPPGTTGQRPRLINGPKALVPLLAPYGLWAASYYSMEIRVCRVLYEYSNSAFPS